MKTKSIVLLLVSAMISLSNIFAQSGRVVPKPTPTPTSMPPIQSPKLSDEKLEFVFDRNADKYKLVFPVSYQSDDKSGASGNDWQHPSSRASFIEELNKVGAQGYKFVAATGDHPFTLVKSDEVQYEYQWFETGSGSSIFGNRGFGVNRAEFSRNHHEMERQGFRLVDNHRLTSWAESCEQIADTFIWDCDFRFLYLYEKEKGAKQANKQTLVNAQYLVDKRPSVELSKQMNEKLNEGFVPVKILSDFDILLEQIEEKDEIVNDKPDVQVVRGSWGRGEVIGKANALAKQGYRIAAANARIIVLYRHGENRAPASFVFVKAKKKNFGKELAKLEAKGAIYRAIYPNVNGNETTLIFELPESASHKRREYKVATFNFELTRNWREGKMYRELTAASKETLKEVNELAKQGFEARDLFVSGRDSVISVLLERESN